MKLRIRRQVLLLWFLPVLIWAQGTYYNSIDTGSTAFVTDLHNLIYPHTQISYDQFDETNIADFASRDTTGGQKAVTCVYSGQNYAYTPPFAWLPFSREHTFCHSWMPTYNSQSGKEYSDQHHLFPTNQNNANAVRSNHPLGTVVNISSTYLQAKFGTNGSGQTVYEPRDSHKGDAARALLYMAVCYNGVNGNDWTFEYLNTVTLPALSEAPQDVDLLIQWHNQDPPDQWEKDRNEYIYSIQGNRNPFIDHPEYVSVIDFNTLTKKTSGSPGGEPTNYPAGFNTPVLTSNSIKVTWSDPSGTILPSGYLLKASTTNSFTDPVNGIEYSNQTDISGGTAVANIAYGTGQYTLTGLSASTTYYFKLYPYNGNTTSRIYKTAGFPASLQQGYTTTAAGSSSGRISITSLTFSYSESFDELENSGSGITWTDSVTINGWSSSRTTYTASTGSSNSGALYSFGADAAADRSLGSVSSGTTGTIYYAVRFVNNSGSTITSIPLSYTGRQWRNGGNETPQILKFEYRINASSITDAGAWTAVPALDFTSPVATASASALDGNLPANKTDLAATISLALQNGEEIWFRWTDINDAGNDHGLSIDDFVLNGSAVSMPVELTAFTAIVKGRSVELVWKTTTETNNHGFEIEHRVAGMNRSLEGNGSFTWTKIGFITGNGTTNSPKEYSFIDKPSSSARYEYRLKQIDRDGKFHYSNSVEVNISIANTFLLGQNYPNPFNPSTSISYYLPVSGKVALKVYDMLGKEVATLVNGEITPGEHRVQFNAKNLPSGIYFYTIRANNFAATKRMLLVK